MTLELALSESCGEMSPRVSIGRHGRFLLVYESKLVARPALARLLRSEIREVAPAEARS